MLAISHGFDIIPRNRSVMRQTGKYAILLTLLMIGTSLAGCLSIVDDIIDEIEDSSDDYPSLELGERARGGPRDVAEEQILLRRHVVQGFVFDLEISVGKDMMASCCGGVDLSRRRIFEQRGGSVSK